MLQISVLYRFDIEGVVLMKRIMILSLLVFIISLVLLLGSEQRGLLFLAKFTLFASIAVPVVTLLMLRTIGRERSRELIGNISLMIVSIGVVLIISEYVVRFLYADVTTTGDNTSYFALRWKNENASTLNSMGFREREISEHKPDGIYRIAIIGDSITYGQGISDHERFSNIVENRLNMAGKRYEVLNFGKPGAETVDHIKFLDSVLTLDPDFILLQWYTNDAEGHDKSRRPRPYRLIPSDYVSGLLHRNSALYYLLMQKWNELQSALGLIGNYSESMDARFEDPESADSRRYDRELSEFVTKVNNHNLGMGIILFPNLVETGGDLEKYPFGYLFDRVLAVCIENGIDCIDMRQVLDPEMPVSELWVNRLDSHPSAAVNAIAADAILERFTKQW